ncbi:GNAT family N-acetyltransferase [bacterium]|nr:GNAT family N-acetyltransferase [bacterium]
MIISPPEHLRRDHDVSAFDSGEPRLDDWLRRWALPNERGGASRTYVVRSGVRVIGYFALAAGEIIHEKATGKIRRNMPDPVPVVLLGRLAIDLGWQGRGIGSDLLNEAIRRTLRASEIIGIRALLVHAISDDAKRFYESLGFLASGVDPMILMITLKDAENSLSHAP